MPSRIIYRTLTVGNGYGFLFHSRSSHKPYKEGSRRASFCTPYEEIHEYLPFEGKEALSLCSHDLFPHSIGSGLQFLTFSGYEERAGNGDRIPKFLPVA
jgi:hypothetical protein